MQRKLEILRDTYPCLPQAPKLASSIEVHLLCVVYYLQKLRVLRSTVELPDLRLEGDIHVDSTKRWAMGNFCQTARGVPNQTQSHLDQYCT